MLQKRSSLLLAALGLDPNQSVPQRDWHYLCSGLWPRSLTFSRVAVGESGVIFHTSLADTREPERFLPRCLVMGDKLNIETRIQNLVGKGADWERMSLPKQNLWSGQLSTSKGLQAKSWAYCVDPGDLRSCAG